RGCGHARLDRVKLRRKAAAETAAAAIVPRDPDSASTVMAPRHSACAPPRRCDLHPLLAAQLEGRQERLRLGTAPRARLHGALHSVHVLRRSVLVPPLGTKGGRAAPEALIAGHGARNRSTLPPDSVVTEWRSPGSKWKSSPGPASIDSSA